jgi:hypothetical protein
MACLAAGLLAPPAHALTTFVNPSGYFYNQERCLIGDAGGLCPAGDGTGAYDGATSIVRAVEIDLGATATRIDDLLDRIWSAPAGAEVTLRVRYADSPSELGYGPPDGGPGDYTPIAGTLPNFQVAVSDTTPFAGDPVPGDFVASSLTPELFAATDFVFVLRTNYFGGPEFFLSSDSTQGSYSNSGSLADWMVAFELDDRPGHYLLAFEDDPHTSSPCLDQPGPCPGDFDYNDYVFELQLVPEPGTLLLVGTGLALLAGRRGRR